MLFSENLIRKGVVKMVKTKNFNISIRLIAAFLFVSIILVGLQFAFTNGHIIMLLENAGIHVTKGVAEALTSISGVYGVQHFIIAALGVSVPVWLAAAVAAAGAAGV